MTGTTNLGLKKIDGTENWRNIFDYHNDSMDAIDQAVAGVENVEANFSVTIPVSGWTLSNGEYSYTWGNATITSKTSVAVEFVENADEIDVDYIEAEKVTQGVKFTAPWIPNYAISVNIKITYAEETDISEITGDMVATDVITGAANVDEALTELDTNLSSLNDSIATITSRLFTGIENGSVIPCTGYGGVIIGGLLGNYGIILFAIFMYGGSIVIKNLFDGSTWTATDSFRASWSSNQLTITCNGGSRFTALVLV